MLSRETRIVLAAIQIVIGAEWLVSGLNKIVSGDFPTGLAAILREGFKENPNDWYVSLLQWTILPHSVGFAYLLEGTELVLGLVLLTGALLLLSPQPRSGEPQHALGVAFVASSLIACIVGAFLCVNFHFWMGDGIMPTVAPSRPFDEGIDLDTLLPPLSLILAYGNHRVLAAMTDRRPFARCFATRRQSGQPASAS